MTREEMEGLLATLYDGKRYITVIENDFKRYVGARIGIYSPRGEKVGQISHYPDQIGDCRYAVVSFRPDSPNTPNPGQTCANKSDQTDIRRILRKIKKPMGTP